MAQLTPEEIAEALAPIEQCETGRTWHLARTILPRALDELEALRDIGTLTCPECGWNAVYMVRSDIRKTLKELWTERNEALAEAKALRAGHRLKDGDAAHYESEWKAEVARLKAVLLDLIDALGPEAQWSKKIKAALGEQADPQSLLQAAREAGQGVGLPSEKRFFDLVTGETPSLDEDEPGEQEATDGHGVTTTSTERKP